MDSNPPAEAPIPTIGKAFSFISIRGFAAAAVFFRLFPLVRGLAFEAVMSIRMFHGSRAVDKESSYGAAPWPCGARIVENRES
jgi:hypothetical protein